MITPVLKIIMQAQSEVVKEENKKSKRIIGHISSFDIDSRGLLTLHGRIWVPHSGETRQILMDEVQKFNFRFI